MEGSSSGGYGSGVNAAGTSCGVGERQLGSPVRRGPRSTHPAGRGVGGLTGLTNEERLTVAHVFRCLDEDRDGLLSREEAAHVATLFGCHLSERPVASSDSGGPGDASSSPTSGQVAHRDTSGPSGGVSLEELLSAIAPEIIGSRASLRAQIRRLYTALSPHGAPRSQPLSGPLSPTNGAKATEPQSRTAGGAPGYCAASTVTGRDFATSTSDTNSARLRTSRNVTPATSALHATSSAKSAADTAAPKSRGVTVDDLQVLLWERGLGQRVRPESLQELIEAMDTTLDGESVSQEDMMAFLQRWNISRRHR